MGFWILAIAVLGALLLLWWSREMVTTYFLKSHTLPDRDLEKQDEGSFEIDFKTFNFRGAKILCQLKGQNLSDQPVKFVLVHGIGAQHRIWNGLTDQLQRQGTCLSVDLPGFGKSEWPQGFLARLEDYTDFFYELEKAFHITTCHYVGSSLGGALVWWYLSAIGSSQHKLTLIAPALFPNRIPSWIPISWTGSQPGLITKMLTRRLFLTLYKSVLSKRTSVQDSEIDQAFAEFKTGNAMRAFLANIPTLKDKRLADQNLAPNIAIQFLHGEKDRQVKLKAIEKRVRVCDRLLVHPWGAHHLMQDDPNWIYRAIVDPPNV